MCAYRPEVSQPAADLSTVESRRNDLTAEEFPEGAYGAAVNPAELGKSTPWRENQRPPNTYTYENRTLHAGVDRGYPGDHNPHDAGRGDDILEDHS